MRKPKRFPLYKALELQKKDLNYNEIGKLLKFNPITVSKNLKKYHESSPEELKTSSVEELEIPKEPESPKEELPTAVSEEDEKKPPTKPWLQTDNPWVPDIFRLASKHQGFVPRFTNPDLIERREGEGFKIARAEDWGEKSQQGDGAYKRRGMILMEMPQEVMESKRVYLKHKTDLQDPSIEQDRIVAKAKQIGRQAGIDMGLRREE